MTASLDQLQGLSEKLLNRRAYTMGHVIAGQEDKNDKDFNMQAEYKKLADSPLVNVIKKDPTFESHIVKKYAVGQESTAAVNELINQIIEAPAPLAIGRELVHFIETMKKTISIRKPALGTAVNTSRGKPSTSKGQRHSYVEITPNLEIESSDEWDLNYLEDAEWNVLAEETQEVSRAVSEEETVIIEAMLQAIADASLATGAEIGATSAGLFQWPDFCNLWGAVASEDFVPDKTAMNPLQTADVFKEEEFTNSLMLGDYVDLSVGKIGRTVLGTDVLSSSLITATDVFMLNSRAAIQWVVRRDKLISSWSDDKEKKYGVQCSMRYGKDYGHKTAVARMDDA